MRRLTRKFPAKGSRGVGYGFPAGVCLELRVHPAATFLEQEEGRNSPQKSRRTRRAGTLLTRNRHASISTSVSCSLTRALLLLAFRVLLAACQPVTRSQVSIDPQSKLQQSTRTITRRAHAIPGHARDSVAGLFDGPTRPDTQTCRGVGERRRNDPGTWNANPVRGGRPLVYPRRVANPHFLAKFPGILAAPVSNLVAVTAPSIAADTTGTKIAASCLRATICKCRCVDTPWETT